MMSVASPTVLPVIQQETSDQIATAVAPARPSNVPTPDRAAAIDAAVAELNAVELIPIKTLEFNQREPDVRFLTNMQHSGGRGYSESDLFNIRNGVLHQDTTNDDGWAKFSTSDPLFSPDEYLTMDVRLRVNEVLAREDPDDPAFKAYEGSFAGFQDGAHNYSVYFDEAGFSVQTPTGTQHADMTQDEMHDLRIEKIDANGLFSVSLDGETVITAQALASDRNSFEFGDGSYHRNNSANIDWDYVRIFEVLQKKTKDPAALEALAAALAQDHLRVAGDMAYFEAREARAQQAVATFQRQLNRIAKLTGAHREKALKSVPAITQNLASARAGVRYWSNRALAAERILQRVVPQEERVQQVLTDMYEANAAEAAAEHREMLQKISDKLRLVEETPLDQQSADAQALALQTIAAELQQTIGTMLGATTDQRAMAALAARASLSPLQADLQSLSDRLTVRSEQVFAELERRIPRYMTADVDLTLGLIERTEQNGVTRNVYADIALPEEIGGSLRVDSWAGGDFVHSNVGISADARANPVIKGNGISFDLCRAGKLTTGVRFSVTAMNDSAGRINARFFAGEQEVGTQSILSGEELQFERIEGVTSVVLYGEDAAARAAGFCIENFQVTANTHWEQIEAPVLRPVTNDGVADIAARGDWATPEQEFTVREWDMFVSNNNIFRRKAGDPSLTGNAKMMISTVVRSDEYVRYHLQGSGRIVGVYYIKDHALHELMPGFFENTGTSVTFAPHMPAGGIVLNVFEAKDAVLVRGESGPTRESVEPEKKMKLSLNIVNVDLQPASSEGFRPGFIGEGMSGRMPVMAGGGGTFKVDLNICNQAPVGGRVRVDVFGGPTHTVQDPLDSTFFADMSPYGTQVLTVNVTAAGDPSSGDRRPGAYFRATLADGTVVGEGSVVTGKVNSADPERTVTEVTQADGTVKQVISYVTPPPKSVEQAEQDYRYAVRQKKAHDARVASGGTYAFDDSVDYDRRVAESSAVYIAALEASGMTNDEANDLLNDDGESQPEPLTQQEIALLVEDGRNYNLILDDLNNNLAAALRGELIPIGGGFFARFERLTSGDISVILVAANHSEIGGGSVSAVYTTQKLSVPRTQAQTFFQSGNTTTLEEINSCELAFNHEILASALREYLQKNPFIFNEPETSINRELILDAFKNNFPLDNPHLRYWLLGSGYHDGNSFHAVDLNSLTGGDTDRGDNIYSVAAGTVRISDADLATGTVIIDHDGWISGYLHMPIFKTEQLTPDGKQIYEIRKQQLVGENIEDTDTSKLIWDGMELDAKEHFGFVGGRESAAASGYNEGKRNAHLHVFAKIGDDTIDLRPAIMGAGVTRVKAFDGGPDSNWLTSVDNATRDVAWDDFLQAWVNHSEKLILDRDPQVSNSSGTGVSQRWIAWHIDPTQRHPIIWEEIGETILESGQRQPVMGWVKIGTNKETSGNNIWDSNSGSWFDYE